MEAAREFFYSALRQGLPIVGAVSGLVWATADGVSRNRTGMVLKGAGFSGLGWAAGYITQKLILFGIDKLAGGQLPSAVSSLQGMGMMPPGTMPNSTQYPEPMTPVSSMPPGTNLDGEGSVTIEVKPDNVVEMPAGGENVKVQGTLMQDAFGSL